MLKEWENVLVMTGACLNVPTVSPHLRQRLSQITLLIVVDYINPSSLPVVLQLYHYRLVWLFDAD